MAENSKESLFTFDPDDFVKGIKTMTGAMNTMAKQSEDNAKAMEGATNKGFSTIADGQKEMVKGQKKIGGQFLKSLIIFEIFKKGVSAGMSFVSGLVKEFLPEIGQVFSVAKQVMFKNLLFPLRKFLLPMLNKVLKWVTASRGMFTKWGQVIVGIFKVIIMTVKAVWDIVKRVFGGLFTELKKMFGGIGKDISEIMNLMLFKITTAIIALQIILQPLADFIGKTFVFIAKAIKNFVKGFVEGFMSVFKSTEDSVGIFDLLGETWDELIEIMDELGVSLDGVGSIFAKVGKVIGVVFGESIRIAIGTVKELFKTLKNLIKLMKGDIGIVEFGSSLVGSFTDTAGRYANAGKNVFNSATGGGSSQKVNDALITKGGKVIELSPDDNVLATKGNPLSGGGGTTLHMPIKVYTSEGDALATGQKVGRGIMDVIRDNLMDEVVLAGG